VPEPERPTTTNRPTTPLLAKTSLKRTLVAPMAMATEGLIEGEIVKTSETQIVGNRNQ
jgi:hypothetical protein